MRIRLLALVGVCVVVDLCETTNSPLKSEGAVDIHKKLLPLTDKIKSILTLSPEKEKLLDERQKTMKMTDEDAFNSTMDYSIDEVNEKTKLRDFLFQGDIVLTSEQADEIVKEINDYVEKRFKRQAFRDKHYPNTVWNNNRVAFFFDASVGEQVKSVFKKAAKVWSDNTCIDIYEDTCALSPDRIRVVVEEGCWSRLGRTGGEQKLSLGSDCEAIDFATHELGHALGLLHTHSRHDRDQFITVDIRNIDEKDLGEFALTTKYTNENYDIPYDLGSIMHYGLKSGSANRNPTVVPIDVMYKRTIGSPFISFYDFLVLNRHYNCTDKCESFLSPASCRMGGFPHPRDCQKCVCPRGYGGALCTERPPGCGGEFAAESTAKTFSDTVGNKTTGKRLREDFDMCTRRQENRDKLLEFSTKFLPVDGCRYGGVEIKTQEDQALTGYRFCSRRDADTVLVSNSNVVPVITYNRLFETTTVIQYRFL